MNLAVKVVSAVAQASVPFLVTEIMGAAGLLNAVLHDLKTNKRKFVRVDAVQALVQTIFKRQ